MKADVLTRGGLALRLKGRRRPQGQRSEKSAEAIVAVRAAKGRTMGRAKGPQSSMTVCRGSRASNLERTTGPSGEAATVAVRVERSSAGGGTNGGAPPPTPRAAGA